MAKEDNIVGLPSDPASDAAEEAAFNAAFNAERGEELEQVEESALGQVDESALEQVEDPTKVEEPVVEDAPVVEALKLFAGLTEEQLAAAIGRAGTLQSTVDKMAGRIGSLMQQIEALRAAPPTTQAAQHALDLKLEKLSGTFPELAALLREDLQGLQQSQAAAPAIAPPPGVTQEQFDAALNERLRGTTDQLNEKIEARILSMQHPDWLDIIKTPQFALFRDNVLPAGEGDTLMKSEDAIFIGSKLTEFKAWREKITAPITQAVPAAVVPQSQSAASQRKARLLNSVLPSGSSTQADRAPQTEEEAFAAAFNKERARSGH